MINFAQAPQSLCIFRLSAIGDVTHILPIIHTLKKVWPTTKITWVIGKLEYQLVKSLPDVEFIQFNKSDGWGAYGKLHRQLKGRHFDILLMMQAALRASIASLFIPARHKLGFDRKRAVDYQWLFSNSKIKGDPRVHVLDGLFQFLESIGIQQRCLDWQLPIAEDDLDIVGRICGQQKYVVINPCSSARKNNWRNWSQTRYAEVVDYLHSKQIKVVLSGGPSAQEIEFTKSIVQQCHEKPVNLVGQTTLGELLALLQKASFMIAPDTGPGHMATVVDTPVIGLFASSNPQRSGPYKSLSCTVNRYPDALQQFNNQNIETASWGERVREPDVMELISVDDVVKNIDSIL